MKSSRTTHHALLQSLIRKDHRVVGRISSCSGRIRLANELSSIPSNPLINYFNLRSNLGITCQHVRHPIILFLLFPCLFLRLFTRILNSHAHDKTFFKLSKIIVPFLLNLVPTSLTYMKTSWVLGYMRAYVGGFICGRFTATSEILSHPFQSRRFVGELARRDTSCN